ncbi:MAG TPA: SpoIID/LytB domain-containing protein, partial [Blastocatellia bacterium]|nr:SpoIID/LytB domain-containing protein [Blastocatellia bacterium]
MRIIGGSGRLRQFAISLTLLVSNSTQIAFLGSNCSGGALAAQKQLASYPGDRRAETDDKSITRARRAGAITEAFQYPSASGPIIRVALMTDVSSIALSSPTGLIVRNASGFEERKAVSIPTLSVELRPFSEPGRVETTVATYRVGVGSSTESGRARKLLDELKKKFFEPVAMTFDEKQKDYSVLIGQFSNRGEAARFLERLRKSGYEGLRIVSDQETIVSPPLTDANARAAKYKAQPTSTSRSSGKSHRRSAQLVALAAQNVAATSEDQLIVSPDGGQHDGGQHQVDRRRQSTGSPRDVRNNTQGTVRAGSAEAESKMGLTPVAVRVGKTDYRGEIHLILNPRGRINVVNALPLEDYLRGVVPMELSPGAYPKIEALKAQAVAARSYALARLGQHLDEGYDLVDDTRAQVYGGLSAERELTNLAIEETRGIAAVFPNAEGKFVPIEALYTANCGGSTENNDEVFGGKTIPYLRAVACSPD